MVKCAAREKGAVAVPGSNLTPSQNESRGHSSKLKSMSALQVVTSQKATSAASLEKTLEIVRRLDDYSDGEWEGIDTNESDDEAQRGEGKGKSGIAGMGVGATGAASGRKKKRRRKRKKKKKSPKNVAISGEVLDPGVNTGSPNPKGDYLYLGTGEDQGPRSDGDRSMAATESCSGGPGFTLATPARKVGKRVPGSTVSSSAVNAGQSTKKRKATEPLGMPGDTTSGPRKRARVNFKEIGYAETPSPRDIPFNYNIRRRRKRPLPQRAEEKPAQEVGGGLLQIQKLAEGEAEKLNQLIEECLERMLKGESPTGSSPVDSITYSTKGPQRSGVSLEEAIGKAHGPPENGSQDISSYKQEIVSPMHPRNKSVRVPPTALVPSGAAPPVPQAHQVHWRRPRAPRRSVSLPPDRRTRRPPYFVDSYEGSYEDPGLGPRTKGSRARSHFSQEVGIKAGNSVVNWPRDDDPCYGLIQEELRSNPFQLLVACMFLNVTSTVRAVGKVREFLTRYPTPEVLAQANVQDVTEVLKTLGLQNRQANTLIAFGREWLRNPPKKYVGARKQGYPRRETLEAFAFPGVCPISKHERFEIAHLPGVGPYALDSWRIFCLDDLRGNQDGEEWTRVTPLDNELRGLLRWRWWARKGVRWVEEGDSEAFKKFWVMKCNGLVCHHMCKAGFPTQRCPREEINLADPESHRGHIPPEFVVGGGRKELIRDQTDIPGPAVMADYIPFGHSTTKIKGSDKPQVNKEPSHPAPTTPAARRGLGGTDLPPIVMNSHALLSELRKRAPWAEGIIKGNHCLRWSKDPNSTDGAPCSPTRSETAGSIYYTLDSPRNNYPQITPAVDVAHPSVPPPKLKRWTPPRGPAFEPPVSSQRRRKYASKTQLGELAQEESSHQSII